MSNEMISVPRELLEQALRGEIKDVLAAQRKLRALLAKPSDQHQGEPVAKLTWEEIVGLVNEVLGCEAHEWPLHDVGHQMTGINFNSLARIIDRVRILYTHPAEQPAPVAVVMSFEFEHPLSKERRTVALSKRDVFDGMEDYFYDKLGEQICQCESVGETNVVDCNCDEYVHDFEIMQACLDEVARLNQGAKS